MAILRNDTTVRSADGQTTSAIVTAANIGSYGISTTSTYYIGTTQNVFNRASASQTLTGVSIDGNAATVTNGVYTTGAQTIGGTKTFSDGIVVNSATYNTFSKPSTTNYQTVTLFGSASGGLFLTTDNAIIGTGAYYNNGWIATATSGRNLDFASGNFTFTAFSGATVGGAASFGTIAQLTSAGVFSTTGDFRAPIFYDSNDTTYYLDPANTGTALLVAGTIAYKPSVGNNVVIGNDATYGTSGTGRFVGIGFGGLSNSANKIFAHNMGEDGLYICSATSRGIYFRANGGSTDHVAITSGGSMGIGTSSPSQKLHVVGNIIVAPASSSWAEGLSFTMPTASTWGGLRWRREVANNDGNHYIGYTGLDSTDDLVFGSNNGGTQINNNIRITKAGLVGIGTIPTQKFHVSGIAYSDTDFRAPIFYDSNDTAYYCDPNGTSRLANLRVYSSFDTASSDVYANMRVIRDAAYTDGLFIGYNNAGTGTTKIFGGGATTGELTKYSNYTLEPGSFRAPIFYDSDNTNYYIDAANTGTSAYFAGQGRQNDGKYTRDFKSFQWVSGTASYYSSGTSGWYKVAQITITSNCTGAVLYGRLYDIAYHDCEIYDISVVIRAECDFTTNNESHFVELGCTVVASSDQTDYRNKIRAVLTASSTNSRTYELQFFETSWNADAWELFTSGWTVYDSAQAPGTSTGTPRVFYQSKMNADIMYANASSRAPIFYDSDNTNYYVDPASGSNVNNLTTAGTLYTNNIAKNANGSPIVINSGLNASGYALRVYYDMQLYNTLTFTDSAWNSQGSINGSSSVVNITAATATTTFTKYAGYSQEGGSFRAPIFYDSNDTNYYLDPASTSRLNTTRIGNINVGSGTYLNTITPIGDTNINLSAPSGAFYFDTFPRMPGFYDSDDTNFYANPAGESKFNYLRLTNNNALYFTTTAPAELNNESNSTDVGFRMIKSGTSFADGNNYGVVNFRRTNHNNTATNAGASIFFELKDSGGTIREYAGISGCKTEAGAAGGRLIFHRYARTELGYWDTDQLYSSSSMRSPIFYDSNDTTYYIDPAASTSINVNGYIISSGTGGNKGALLGNLQVGYAGTYNTVQTPTNADTIWFQYSHSGNVGLAYGGGYTTAYGSIRSPIFYDSDNTAYYVDPASTSNLNGLTVAGGNATIYRDLTVNGGTGGSYGNRIIVQGTATTYTLQDNAIRPTVYLTGAYPVVTLNHTVTNNANHGPTIQFAFNGLTTGGSTSRQIVIGANGTATYLDFGFSGGGSGTNSDYNPHNGIAGYAGLTPMRLFSNGLLLGSTGTYPNHIISTSYALDVRGTGYSNTDFRAPIFYDSDNTSYYINAASTSNLVGLTVANTITGSVSGNSATATNVAWTGITQATRTNYDLTFQPPNSGYAGFTFNTTGGVAGSAGYFLVRGTSDSDVYTAEGITLVADAGWLTLAQRTTASRGVKIMTGTTSAERLKVTTAGDFQIVNGNSFTYNGNVVLHAGNYTSYTLPIGGSWYGANLPGTRWNGMSVNGGEIVFGRDLPAVGQMGILVDGCYIAGENNGFWSLGSSNDWGTRRGFYWDGSYLNFTTGSAVALFNDARATIFYDSNDTTYYIDPASTSLINSLKIAGGIYNNGSVTDDDTFGIFWESSYSSAYAIFREPGAWQNPYPDLRIAFHTGIKLGANSGYNGIRFYNDYDMATQVMSVNNNGDALGANNVYVNNSLVAGSSLRAPIFYDTNNTAYYIDPASSSRVDVITSNDDYTYGWFRSYTSGYGIYNQVTGQHFYSDDVSYWNVASSSSSQGIRLRTGGYGGTVRGYFYADTNNDVGILNNAGNWRLRVVGGDYGLADGSSMRAQIFYDSNNTGYYIDAASTSVLSSLTIAADANVELYKSQTVDMSNTTTYSTSNYYPVTIPVLTEGCIIQIQNNLNSNVPSWSTHGAGFTLNLKWRTNASGWGTTDVRRYVEQYHERFANQTICGGITQMTNSSIEVVWLRGGGQYLFKFSRNLTATAQSATFTSNSQSVSPTSSAQNAIWDSVSGYEKKYNNTTLSTDSMYTPVLYDYNNTAYYIDAASTSNLVGLTVANTITGSISGNAVTAGGLAVHTGTNNEANKIVRTDGNGYLNAGWINTPSGDMADTATINRIYCSDDNYIRYKGVADFQQQIGLTYKYSTPRSANTTDTNYWVGTMGWGTTDLNTMFDYGCGFFDSWSNPGNQPSGSSHWNGIQSIHYTNGSSRYGWQMVVGAGSPAYTYIRGTWGTSFGSWYLMWNSANDGAGSGLDADLLDGYNSATANTANTIVLRDGSGNFSAGTITAALSGNATTATSATTATGLNSSNYISRVGSSGNYNTDFQNTPAGTVRHLGDDANATNNPGNAWWFVDNYRHSNGSNYWGTQVAWGWEDNANRLATRNVTGGTFGSWVYYLNSGNYSNYAIARGGDTVTGTIYFQSNLGTTSGSLSSPPLQAYSTGNNSAFMSFHKGGYYAVNMGLDSDNVLRIGGWSASANRWELDMSGNNWVASSFRAPIFYDSNDTNYYVDPASTSNLLLVKTRNTFGQRIAVTASSPITIDTQYSLTQLTLTGSISSMSFSNIQADGIVHMWTIVTVGNATAYTITWPAAVKWPGGTAPTVTTTNTKRDIYQFVTYDGGTNIYAIIVGQNL